MDDKGEPTRLFLVRHAQSANNALGEARRVSDPAITELGWQQAQRLGEYLSGFPFESLITSAFRRSLQTASQIQLYLELKPEVVIDIHEHGGCYEGWHEGNFSGQPGLTAEQIQNEFGDVHIPKGYPENGWWESKPRESHPDSDERAYQMSSYLKQRLANSDGNLVCVTHADFLAKLLLAMFGEAIKQNDRYFDLKNVGITTVGLDETAWKLYELNSVEYLPSESVSS